MLTDMLSIYCPRHGSEVLVGTGRIRNLINTDHGIRLHVECYCGYHVHTTTGRRARNHDHAVAAA